jgi:hypothetical protein
VGYGESSPNILDVMDVVTTREFAPWVQDCYMDKFRRSMGDKYTFLYEEKTGSELACLVRVLKRIPEGPTIAAEQVIGINSRLRYEHSEEDRGNLKELLKLAEKADAEKER